MEALGVADLSKKQPEQDASMTDSMMVVSRVLTSLPPVFHSDKGHRWCEAHVSDINSSLRRKH